MTWDDLAFEAFVAWCGTPPEDKVAGFRDACRKNWNDERDHLSRLGWIRVVTAIMERIYQDELVLACNECGAGFNAIQAIMAAAIRNNMVPAPRGGPAAAKAGGMAVEDGFQRREDGFAPSTDSETVAALGSPPAGSAASRAAAPGREDEHG